MLETISCGLAVLAEFLAVGLSTHPFKKVLVKTIQRHKVEYLYDGFVLRNWFGQQGFLCPKQTVKKTQAVQY